MELPDVEKWISFLKSLDAKTVKILSESTDLNPLNEGWWGGFRLIYDVVDEWDHGLPVFPAAEVAIVAKFFVENGAPDSQIDDDEFEGMSCSSSAEEQLDELANKIDMSKVINLISGDADGSLGFGAKSQKTSLLYRDNCFPYGKSPISLEKDNINQDIPVGFNLPSNAECPVGVEKCPRLEEDAQVVGNRDNDGLSNMLSPCWYEVGEGLKEPPSLFFVGGKDPYVPPQQSRKVGRFRNAIRVLRRNALGVSVIKEFTKTSGYYVTPESQEDYPYKKLLASFRYENEARIAAVTEHNILLGDLGPFNEWAKGLSRDSVTRANFNQLVDQARKLHSGKRAVFKRLYVGVEPGVIVVRSNYSYSGLTGLDVHTRYGTFAKNSFKLSGIFSEAGGWLLAIAWVIVNCHFVGPGSADTPVTSSLLDTVLGLIDSDLVR